MGRTRVLVAAIVALAAGTGCNAVLGAEEPEVVGRGADVGDLDPPGAPGACGDGMINRELGESCDDENENADDGCAECKIVCGPFPEALDESTGHCYRLGGGVVPGTSSPAAMQEPAGWDEAEVACASWYGALATITPTITTTESPPSTSYDELAFIQHFGMHEEEAIWLGGKRQNGAFTWQTGEPLSADPTTEKSWAPGHPTASPNDCVALGNESLAFESLDCAAARPYLCERGVAGQAIEE